MYLADSRSTKPAVAPDTRPGRRPAAVPGTVLALGAVSLITDVSSEMITAVLPLYVVVGLGLSPLGFGLLDGINNGVGALVRLAGDKPLRAPLLVPGPGGVRCRSRDQESVSYTVYKRQVQAFAHPRSSAMVWWCSPCR